jgi:DNA gyrase subunit B
VGIHPEAGINTVELVLTTLHAGAKFGEGGYKVSGGLHGVGVSAVNALSEHLVVEVRWRDGKIYRQEFSRGKKLTELTVVGETTETGTTVTFLPDREIFGEINYNFSKLTHRLQELAYLVAGLTIRLDNRMPGAFPESSRTARARTLQKPSFSSWRAIPQAAPQNKAGTALSRPFCPCAEKS